jgi:hypothetical protein
MTGKPATESDFDNLLDATLAEWPNRIDVSKGIIYDEGGGKFDRLVTLKDEIEDRLTLSARFDLVE